MDKEGTLPSAKVAGKSKNFYKNPKEVGKDMSMYNKAYFKSVKYLELWLDKQCNNTDLKTYFLSDSDFLERHARLKYQVNKDG